MDFFDSLSDFASLEDEMLAGFGRSLNHFCHHPMLSSSHLLECW